MKICTLASGSSGNSLYVETDHARILIDAGISNDKGKSSVTVRINLIDKNTGEMIADQSIEGRAKPPGYGESRYIRVRDEIVSLVTKAKN